MMAVPIQTEPNFSAETPRQLFEGDYLNDRSPSFDVHPDGRFLMVKSGDTAVSTVDRP